MLGDVLGQVANFLRDLPHMLADPVKLLLLVGVLSKNKTLRRLSAAGMIGLGSLGLLSALQTEEPVRYGLLPAAMLCGGIAGVRSARKKPVHQATVEAIYDRQRQAVRAKERQAAIPPKIVKQHLDAYNNLDEAAKQKNAAAYGAVLGLTSEELELASQRVKQSKSKTPPDVKEVYRQGVEVGLDSNESFNALYEAIQKDPERIDSPVDETKGALSPTYRETLTRMVEEAQRQVREAARQRAIEEHPPRFYHKKSATEEVRTLVEKGEQFLNPDDSTTKAIYEKIKKGERVLAADYDRVVKAIRLGMAEAETRALVERGERFIDPNDDDAIALYNQIKRGRRVSNAGYDLVVKAINEGIRKKSFLDVETPKLSAIRERAKRAGIENSEEFKTLYETIKNDLDAKDTMIVVKGREKPISMIDRLIEMVEEAEQAKAAKAPEPKEPEPKEPEPQKMTQPAGSVDASLRSKPHEKHLYKEQ